MKSSHPPRVPVIASNFCHCCHGLEYVALGSCYVFIPAIMISLDKFLATSVVVEREFSDKVFYKLVFMVFSIHNVFFKRKIISPDWTANKVLVLTEKSRVTCLIIGYC